MTRKPIKAPFPAFGGKSKIAATVWRYLGNPRNYVEPFCFSAANLLLRPELGAIETINDVNSFVANFWRAIQGDPERTAHYADWPVNEADLHARHQWLVRSHTAATALARVKEDPEYFDAKIAGWWCWGACCWIGSGWCSDDPRICSPEVEGRPTLKGDNPIASPLHQTKPDLSGDGSTGRGVHAPEGNGPAPRRPGRGQAGWGISAGQTHQNLPHRDAGGRGVGKNDVDHAKRPVISADGSAHGRGIHGQVTDEASPIWSGRGSALQSPRHLHQMEGNDGRPQLADAFSRGRGVNSNDDAGTCQRRREWITDWFCRLADRLRPVRVCCGHWARVCDSDSTLTRLGLTGVFLDPPYRKKLADGSVNRTEHIYANDHTQDVNALCDEVEEWCLKWGGDPQIRIVLCGLEGEYPRLDAAGWRKEHWKSNGGYGNRSQAGRDNAARERLWINAACLRSDSLFEQEA